MDSIFSPIMNDNTRFFVTGGNNVRRRSQTNWLAAATMAKGAVLPMLGLAAAMVLAPLSDVHALPTDGTVAAGTASIASTKSTVTVNQSSQNAVINWQSFGIGTSEAVSFQQPNSSSVTLNRVLGADPSNILGSLSANGQVFLVNPNGVLFAKGAQVNVAGLVTSTLGITDANFMAGNYTFAGSSDASIVNKGSITAHGGGYVALLGAKINNEGVITARLGAVTLAAGSAMTVDVAGNGLLNVAVDQGAVKALVKNGGLIRANGGQVVMTAQAAGQLLKTVVNNTGVIEAQTVGIHNGTISLLGDMQSGTVEVSGTLDASAPKGGNGGFIETSAAQVNITKTAKITTAAPKGVTGTWSIDPVDFTIGAGGNIAGSTLSALLVTNSVVISTLAPGTNNSVAGTPPVTDLFSTTPGNGDITVNDAVSWTATPSTTTLTLDAARDVNVNNSITATNGNVVVCCGRDVNVNAAITTTDGSVLLSAGRNVNLSALAAMTTTDGNIEICAADNINESAAMTLTRGSSVPSQSLGLPSGLTLIAGNGGTGPGVAGGTLIITPGTPPITVTGPNAAVVIDYNPTSYATPTNYLTDFTLTGGATVSEFMLVFPDGDKVFDGTTATTLTGFNSTAVSGVPAGVTLVADPGATAAFDSSSVGTGIGITFSGYSLAGVNAAEYALAAECCVSGSRTSGAITVPPPVPPPVVVTPPVVVVVTTPVVTPPVVTPPVVTPPVETPPVETPPVGTPVVVTPLVVTTLVGTAAVVAPVEVLALATSSSTLPAGLALGGFALPVQAPVGAPLVVVEQGVRLPPVFAPVAPAVPYVPPAAEYPPIPARN